MPGKTWRSLLLAPIIFVAPEGWSQESTWQKLAGCQLVDGPHNDGDSIEVEHGGQRYVFRLFFVDCVEKSPHSRARRVDQAKYFGLTGENLEDSAMQVAYDAARFTKEQLSSPFTVYTRWQKVDPTGANPAIRAFVETSAGADLSSLLVSKGLAIIREGKVGSDHPNGKNVSEQVSALREAETKARLEGRGAWALARTSESGAPPPSTQKSDFAATDKDALFASAGRPVIVRGRVAKIGALPDGRITFLDFAGNQTGGFVGVIRADFLPLFRERYPEGLDQALVGKEITLKGVITLYRNIPQIELEQTAQIQIVPVPQPQAP